MLRIFPSKYHYYLLFSCSGLGRFLFFGLGQGEVLDAEAEIELRDVLREGVGNLGHLKNQVLRLCLPTGPCTRHLFHRLTEGNSSISRFLQELDFLRGKWFWIWPTQRLGSDRTCSYNFPTVHFLKQLVWNPFFKHEPLVSTAANWQSGLVSLDVVCGYKFKYRHFIKQFINRQARINYSSSYY